MTGINLYTVMCNILLILNRLSLYCQPTSLYDEICELDLILNVCEKYEH